MILKSLIPPTLLSFQKIWEQAVHNSMTDLIRYRDQWFCVFRESNSHVGGEDGVLRLISSGDSLLWQTAALFAQEGIDLRDPKLSITPTGQLMLLSGGLEFNKEKKLLAIHSKVAFSEDGYHWSPLHGILANNEWLWRVTWHRGKAYGVSYSLSDMEDRYKEWNVKLFESLNGLNYTFITEWDILGYPNETTLRFLPSGEMVALVRREKKHNNYAWIGFSEPPYTEWRWHPTRHYVGGPNFLIISGHQMWVSGRLLLANPFLHTEKTFVGRMDSQDIVPLVVLPSGGDCSYPGMFYHEGILWMTYYSSHEGKASIYLARLAI
jgi:hypothetical protein